MRGGVSIIVQSDTRTSKWLDEYFRNTIRLLEEDGTVYIVPTDEVPYELAMAPEGPDEFSSV